MDNKIIKQLNSIKADIPWQTYKTIRGQIRAGDIEGARVGIGRLKRRLGKEGKEHAHIDR